MKKNFFFAACIFLLVLSLIGFSDNLFYDVGQESNSDPKFIIHGVFFLGWFVILVIQSDSIRKGDYQFHKQLGIWGMLIALGVVISTFYVFFAIYEGFDSMPFHVKANRAFTTSFAILVMLAYLQRKDPIRHKRYLYIATLYVLGPVLDRVGGRIGIDGLIDFAIFESIIWNSLFAMLFYYDWITLKKIHRISIYGFIWFYAIWILCFSIT